jgi:uncharacterized membrane protein
MNVHMNASFPIVQVVVGLIGTAIWFFAPGSTTPPSSWKKVGEVLMFAGYISACFAAH